MSLRAALGEGPQGLRAPFQALGPERLVMLGIRDADPAEEHFIQEAKVKRLTTRDLQSNLEDSIRVVTDMAGPTGLLHVHLDLDVMDPSANVPTAGRSWHPCRGLLPAELKALLGRLSSAFAGRICGTTVTELRLREEADLDRADWTWPVRFPPGNLRSELWLRRKNSEPASASPNRFTRSYRQLRNLFQEDLRLRSTVLLEWAAADLFSRFTLQAILEIVVALLLEFRVVVVSQSPELASKLVLGLSSLLWPFSWQHLLLPICPAYLQEAIIDAPVPFISALPEVTPQVATASGTAPPRAKLLLTGSQQMRCTCGGKLELESR
eukprot:s419_g35.t1